MREARYAEAKICFGAFMVRTVHSGVNGISPVEFSVGLNALLVESIDDLASASHAHIEARTLLINIGEGGSTLSMPPSNFLAAIDRVVCVAGTCCHADAGQPRT